MPDTRKRYNSPSCAGEKNNSGLLTRPIYSKSGGAGSSKLVGHGISDKYYSVLNSSRYDAQFGKAAEMKILKIPSTVKRKKNRCDVGLTRPNSKELLQSKCVPDFGIYLKAFALIYILPEEDWLPENIGRLLAEGEELFDADTDGDYADGPMHESGIYIKRTFMLGGHNFTLELRPPCQQHRFPHIISNLKPVLQNFFRTSHYCMFHHRGFHLLIWRRRKLFFIMDVRRRHGDAVNSLPHRVEMLSCLQTLDNVVYLLANLSDCKGCDEFALRELIVSRLVTPDGRTFLRNHNQISTEYSVVNKNYAYLKSNLHLSLNPANMLRNGGSLIVGVTGILAANIEHPASWNTSTLDRIICFGFDLYRSCWCPNAQDCSLCSPIDLDTFPTQVRLGQFVAEIKLLPEMWSGSWRGSLTYLDIDGSSKIRQVLKTYGNALFQINSQIYTLWYRDDNYYLLDPYRHFVMTTSPATSENGITKCPKWATVRMFPDLPNMLSVFHQLLRESNRHSTLFVHVVAIKHIAKCPPDYVLKPMPPNIVPNLKPLNATISFPQKLSNAEQLLAEDSDYEPDVSNDPEDATDVESFTLINSDLKNIEVKVEVLKSSRAKYDIHKEFSALSKPTKATQITTKVKDYVKDNKTTNRLNCLRRKHCTVDPNKNGTASVKRKAELKSTTSTATAVNPTSTTRQPHGTDKLSNIDAKMCAMYQHLPIDRNKIGGLGQCSRCSAGQTAGNVSQTSYQSAQQPDESLAKDLMPEMKYPAYSSKPKNLAIVGSESGTVESLNRLLDAAFGVTNRVLTMTPWGNYVVFRVPGHKLDSANPNWFFLFDGCTCKIDCFRHLDLSKGTDGLLPFKSQSNLVSFMIDSRETRALALLRSRLEQPSRGT
ncbi:uncharacterized protein LOC6558076 isoform X2 [Drosophila grimshawi]|uniref:uncharacterized protein LOC6558076 isoform X2 n=1 Tax=Drosophila grimshawi TaxID=7222 RepID=UPI000C870397|nr:uncharacterized protein LOC6558076 isoform X2 [Drosophila grimshawi]